MNNKPDIADPDDFFAHPRMSFGDHIEDLRTHLIRAIKGFLLALFVSFFLAKYVLAFIRAPVERQLVAFWDRYHANRVAELAETEGSDDQGTNTVFLRIQR